MNTSNPRIGLTLTALLIGLLALTEPVVESTRSSSASAQSGEIVLTAVADTWIHSSILPPERRPPPETHGLDPELRTGVHDAQGSWQALVRFDLSAIGDDMNIAAARLELYAESVSSPGGSERARSRVRTALGSWAEATLQDGELPATGPELAAITPTANGWATFDVTSAIRSWRSGAKNFGFVVSTYGDYEVWVTYGSRESENPPRLVLVVGTGGAEPDLQGWGSAHCIGPTTVTIVNSGAAAAGHFVVRSSRGTLVREFSGLGPGETQDFAVAFDLEWPLTVDADDEVLESDEGNNVVSLAIPGCHMYLPWLDAGRGRR